MKVKITFSTSEVVWTKQQPIVIEVDENVSPFKYGEFLRQEIGWAADDIDIHDWEVIEGNANSTTEK